MEPKYLTTYTCELLPLSNNKPIYYRKDNPSIVIKEFSDLEAMKKELDLQLEAQMFVPCPKIVDNFVESNKGYIAMNRIFGDSVYTRYGDDPKKVPKTIWKQIYAIVSKLYFKDIHYVDITSFNFIIDANEIVHIIDFGDAYKMKVNWFLKDFLDGEISWNPDFE